MDEVMEAVKIAGSRQGDVVFISVPADVQPSEFERFRRAFTEMVSVARDKQVFFPQCVVLQPGISATVAHEHPLPTCTLDGQAVAGTCVEIDFGHGPKVTSRISPAGTVDFGGSAASIREGVRLFGDAIARAADPGDSYPV